jgi:mannose-6-phosphate isomerase-like protein (cupin superfamily)
MPMATKTAKKRTPMVGFYLALTFSLTGSISFAQQRIPLSDSFTRGAKHTHVCRLFGDSLSTTFLISIKKEVPAHKHEYHSEVVHVLRGKGRMILGNNSFVIRKNDIIFIPKGTVHAVKTISLRSLRVLSVQSPMFDGSDRVTVGNDPNTY